MSNKDTLMRDVEVAADRLRTALYNLGNTLKLGEGDGTMLRISTDEAVIIKEVTDKVMTSASIINEWSTNTVVAHIAWQAGQMGYTLVKKS